MIAAIPPAIPPATVQCHNEDFSGEREVNKSRDLLAPVWLEPPPFPETVLRLADADVKTVSRPLASVIVMTTVLKEVIVDRPCVNELSPDTGTRVAGSITRSEDVSEVTSADIADDTASLVVARDCLLRVVVAATVVEGAVVGAARHLDDTSPKEVLSDSDTMDNDCVTCTIP